MFRRLLLLSATVALVVFMVRMVGPDVRRYIKISRM